MAKPLRPKRGTTAKNDAFTGLASEITIDTEKHSIRVHDGVTAGGYEILPKTKNDELYAPKNLDVGVTSFNGSKGAVTYSAPVSSVNGKTGAVTVDVGVTSVNGKTGAVTGIVTSVNGLTADPSGNVAIQLGGTLSLVGESDIAVAAKKATTYTVTGLTPYKPLYFVFNVLTGSSYTFTGTVVSGAYEAGGWDSSDESSTHFVKGNRGIGLVIPTGTSVAFNLYCTQTVTIASKFYQ